MSEEMTDLVERLRDIVKYDTPTCNGCDDIIEAAVEIERQAAEILRWKELCGSMLIHVEPGAGQRRAERYEEKYNELVSY